MKTHVLRQCWFKTQVLDSFNKVKGYLPQSWNGGLSKGEESNTSKKIHQHLESSHHLLTWSRCRCCIENITPDTCVCLRRKEDDEETESKPELEIKCKEPIQEMCIFSEGSLIEVFGLHDEYLFTSAPIFVDDWEGMAVYQARLTLPGIRRCKLKFTRIKEKSRLWIYNVQILISKSDESSKQIFNFDYVNKLLNNNNISQKAEKFKQMFEMFAKNSENGNSASSNLHLLLPLLNREGLQTSKSVPECPTSPSSITSTIRRSSMDYDLENYIEERFNRMKQEIMTHLEVKLEEMRDETQKKLDKIIKLLEASKV